MTTVIRCRAERLRRRARALLVRADGQATTEYAIVLGVIVVGLAAAIVVLEPPIQSIIGKVSASVAIILP